MSAPSACACRLHATVNCGEYNQCADIWSLAVTIHTVLTGRTPFQYGEKDIFAYDSPTVRLHACMSLRAV